MLDVSTSQSGTSKTCRTTAISGDTGMKMESNCYGLFNGVTMNLGWVRCNMGDCR
jgi:hypothetical protein